MVRRVMMIAGAFVASAVLATACATTDAQLAAETEGANLQETAFDCAGGVYDKMFLTSGERMYRAPDRNQITGMLRDSAVAGQGADADAERRIRNILGDGYGRLFLDAYQGCMAVLT